jgi:voltage-gated potassium channel Kch
MGNSLGHLTQEHVAMIIMVAVITMTISTYLILDADKVYRHIKNYLSFFEKSGKREKAYVVESKLDDHIVLVGCDRTGKTIAVYLLKKNIPFLVVDFNPNVYTKLTAENIPVIFGDITDEEIIEASNLGKARMVISTTSNLEDNLTLISQIKGIRNPPVSVFTASMRNEAVKLYEAGANYVIVPDVVAGDHIRHILRAYGTKGKRLSKAGKLHFNRLIFK